MHAGRQPQKLRTRGWEGEKAAGEEVADGKAKKRGQETSK